MPGAFLLHIVLWFCVRSDLTNSAAISPQLRFLTVGQAPFTLLREFWNLISSRRVKGWRPRPDPLENGVCVKRFTPWGVGERFRSSVEGGTPNPFQLLPLTTHNFLHLVIPWWLWAQHSPALEQIDRFFFSLSGEEHTVHLVEGKMGAKKIIGFYVSDGSIFILENSFNLGIFQVLKQCCFFVVDWIMFE